VEPTFSQFPTKIIANLPISYLTKNEFHKKQQPPQQMRHLLRRLLHLPRIQRQRRIPEHNRKKARSTQRRNQMRRLLRTKRESLAQLQEMLRRILPPTKRIHSLLRMSKFRRLMPQIRKLEKVLLQQRRGHQRSFEPLQDRRSRGMAERTGPKMALHVLQRTHILVRRKLPPLRSHITHQQTMSQG
jgi:hypothetical protein